jgi:hypothetical protein
LTLPLDRGGDLAHHVYDALEDEAAQPLRDLEHEPSEGFDSFTELETSLSEWSFGYGVAWAIARTREPFASSRRLSELAGKATAIAWRSFSDEPWRTLISADRAARLQPEPAPQPPNPDEAQPAAPAASESPEGHASSEAQLEDFMGGLARARSRRPREHDEPPGPEPRVDP